jgi:hypothetical protein
MSDADAVAKAREYIAVFCRHTLPGTQWVDTNTRRIRLEHMTDADALFVAVVFRRIEAEAARRRPPGARAQ